MKKVPIGDIPTKDDSSTSRRTIESPKKSSSWSPLQAHPSRLTTGKQELQLRRDTEASVSDTELTTTGKHPHLARNRALLFTTEEQKAMFATSGEGPSVAGMRKDIPASGARPEGKGPTGSEITGKPDLIVFDETLGHHRFTEAFWDGLRNKGLEPKWILRDTNPDDFLGKAYKAYGQAVIENKIKEIHDGIKDLISHKFRQELIELQPELVSKGLTELSMDLCRHVIEPEGPVWQACIKLSKTPQGSDAEKKALDEAREYINMNIRELYEGGFLEESSIDWKGIKDEENAAKSELGSTTASEVSIDTPGDSLRVGAENTESAAKSELGPTTASKVSIDTPMISAGEIINREELLALDESGFNAHIRDIGTELSTIAIKDIDKLEQLGLTMENSKETFNKHAEKAASRDSGTNRESIITALEGMREIADSLESWKKTFAHIKPSKAVREWMGEEQDAWFQDGDIELEVTAKKTYPDDKDSGHRKGREDLREEWRRKETKQKRLNDWEQKYQFDHLLKYSIDERANILTEHFERLISAGKLNMENLLKYCSTDFYVRIRDIVGTLSTIVTKGFDDLEQHGLTFKISRQTFNKNVEDTNRYRGRNTKYRITALEGVIETANSLERLKKEVARIEPSEAGAEAVRKWMNAGKDAWLEKQELAWETEHLVDHLSKYGTDDPSYVTWSTSRLESYESTVTSSPPSSTVEALTTPLGIEGNTATVEPPETSPKRKTPAIETHTTTERAPRPADIGKAVKEQLDRIVEKQLDTTKANAWFRERAELLNDRQKELDEEIEDINKKTREFGKITTEGVNTVRQLDISQLREMTVQIAQDTAPTSELSLHEKFEKIDNWDAKYRRVIVGQNPEVAEREDRRINVIRTVDFIFDALGKSPPNDAYRPIYHELRRREGRIKELNGRALGGRTNDVEHMENRLQRLVEYLKKQRLLDGASDRSETV